ncbi:response regulator transcription factor [Sulfitobacter aestuariivivens]|uniref:Response regulator transcription factor n=2 Tax=Sulfitobacter aestuariivivens TaxID=2766981 RepID=A0A927HH83_9RHOB|nr:response regulator transcription factor [Sulfitobacter aestuariivivens]MBD3666278.1 response regulator transcription factor [Sulfitobacter aestuariivivens]
MRIVLVEDNSSLAKGISYRLEDSGHAVDVLTDGNDAEQFLKSDTADLIILDINLPGVDGLTLLKDLRRRGDARPVILLTARAETQDRVIGLDAGADDYLIKPFEMAELEARIRALLRRRDVPQQQFRKIGALNYDPATRQLFANKTEIDLPRREMSVFECLLEAEGRLVSKSALLDHVYGTGADIDEKVMEVYVSRLRSKLSAHGIQIVTRRGLGYKITEKQS